MWTNQDRVIAYGAMALIAYLLYKQNNPDVNVLAGDCRAPAGASQASPWIRQLSGENFGVDYFTPRCGMFGRCG